MSWNMTDENTTELDTIAERLNACRERRELLILELDNEKFKNKYIGKREKLAKEKLRTHMYICIPLTIIAIGSIAACINFLYLATHGRYDEQVGLGMLFSCLIALGSGALDLSILVPALKMGNKFNPIGKKKNGNRDEQTFDMERKNADEKITLLEKQVEDIDDEIEKLQIRKNECEIIIASKKDAITDDTSTMKTSVGKFAFKTETQSGTQIEELTAFYNREIDSLQRKKEKLESERDTLQRNILQVSEDFKMAKNRIFIFVIVTAVVTFMHGVFSGVTYHLLSFVICIVLVSYLLWVISVCKKPIILYMVEQKSPHIQDYAFVNDLKPISEKRKQVIEGIQECKTRIMEYEEKIQKLTNGGTL